MLISKLISMLLEGESELDVGLSLSAEIGGQETEAAVMRVSWPPADDVPVQAWSH